MELVDATLRGEDRRLIDAARNWANSPERAQAIRSYQDLTGCNAYRAAEVADTSSAIEFREERERQAEAERRREAAESGAWFAERRVAEHNLSLGLPADASALERYRLGLVPGMSDDDGRDRSAPLGSTANPVQFYGWRDPAYEAQAHGRAERSLSEAVNDSLIERARAQAEDPYMKLERARFHQRQAIERRQRTEAAAPSTATRAESGLGWPEYGGGREIVRTTRDAFAATA